MLLPGQWNIAFRPPHVVDSVLTGPHASQPTPNAPIRPQ